MRVNYKFFKRNKYIFTSLFLCVIIVSFLVLQFHKQSITEDSNTSSSNQPIGQTDTSNTNDKYAPKYLNIGQPYYDDNHLISYELVSVDTNYVDPKLQNSDYCPEAQQQEAQGSHIIQPVSCTITSKLLTWNFTNTSDKPVDVPGVYAMYDCKASSSSKDSSQAGFSVISEGYDPGPGVNSSLYWVTHTSYPEDPAKVLSQSNILTQTLVDTIYQPHETKTVKSELGHNCTAVGESVLGGSYTGWKI